jgi:hypothetical protein
VRNLRVAGTARKAAGWACYHTDMYVTDHAGISIGIGIAVTSNPVELVLNLEGSGNVHVN